MDLGWPASEEGVRLVSTESLLFARVHLRE
jgi:hypothetical protein